MDRIRAIGGETGTDGDFVVFEGNRYNRKGFLFKSFAMSAIVSFLRYLDKQCFMLKYFL